MAKKLGVEVSVLFENESEEVALSSAIKEGRSDYQVDTNEFVKSLEKDFWNELSDEQKKEIEIAISELDSGEGIRWDEFRKQVP
jgi:hypothetical protein